MAEGWVEAAAKSDGSNMALECSGASLCQSSSCHEREVSKYSKGNVALEMIMYRGSFMIVSREMQHFP